MLCPSCHKSMHEVTINFHQVDYLCYSCESCLSFWLDHNSVARFDGSRMQTRKEHVADVRCPRCKNVYLDRYSLPDATGFFIEKCRRCSGMIIRKVEKNKDLKLENKNHFINFIESLYHYSDHERQVKKARALPASFKIHTSEETDFSCPGCANHLTKYSLSEHSEADMVDFDICDFCFGIWLDREDLGQRAMIKKENMLEVDYDSIMPTRRNCPKCADTKLVSLKFKDFATIIDCCTKCLGTWLDGGELEEFSAHLGQQGKSVLDTLIDNSLFQRPELVSILKKFSQTIFNLDAQIQEQEKNLEQAREIQNKLLFKNEKPRSFIEKKFNEYHVICFWHPARTVGGDFFDFIPFHYEGRDYLGICIADISGKGLPASLLMTNLQALLTVFAPYNPSPASLCKQLNSIFYSNSSGNKFITLFYGVIDFETHVMTYTNAGHNPQLLDTGSELTSLEKGGTVIGLLPDWDYEEGAILLPPKSRLVLFTDGVSEAQREDGVEFEEKEIAQMTEKYRNEDLVTAHRNMVRAVKEFTMGYYHDDTTLILMERE